LDHILLVSLSYHSSFRCLLHNIHACIGHLFNLQIFHLSTLHFSLLPCKYNALEGHRYRVSWILNKNLKHFKTLCLVFRSRFCLSNEIWVLQNLDLFFGFVVWNFALPNCGFPMMIYLSLHNQKLSHQVFFFLFDLSPMHILIVPNLQTISYCYSLRFISRKFVILVQYTHPSWKSAIFLCQSYFEIFHWY